MLHSGFIILLASIMMPASFASAQNSSADPVCDKNVLPDVIDSTLGKQGEVCGFPLAVHLNFTQCCAQNQPIYYTGPCTQYCLADKNQTADFSDCVGHIAYRQNFTLGISGCQKSGAMRSRKGTWGGVSLGLGVAVVGFASM
ncbi:hypothetical protein ONS95_003366 [Cadophora gregata]|uniref:uncharacterized protein n=1 Tax=Cadophora gregata TaxID=51156 RepID=UPI0026DB2906|nr:uncharacterized protein ONS95_003366 [Cadophora gregata]KAK0108568.1 hypothetical protein ONS95_003366 [Cadophora gregata]KAK0108838.1 hypothetical protein ONS96_002679 [Cadophora gregata f. sp. sojae]